jgi:DNA-binding NarL/FixJ family response regulator
MAHAQQEKLVDVAIVEDNKRYLDELALLLSNTKNIRIVGRYTNGKEAVEEITKLSPDVTLIDIELPDISGVDVIGQVSSRGCPTEFLVLTVYDDDAHLFSALQAGAVGYIVKGSTSLSEIESAIHEVIDGGAPMSRVIAKRVLETFKSAPGNVRKTKFDELTKREMQILEYIKLGYSTKKVGEELEISYETVRTHLKNIYQKLHVHTLVEAMLLFNQR